MTYILYNPLANNKKGEAALEDVKPLFSDKEFKVLNVLDFKDEASSVEFLKSTKADDVIVLCGGDGTLYKFANIVYGLNLPQKIYYYPGGCGNDFSKDVESTPRYLEKLIPLNEFLKSLPTVTVNGETHHFINGIGFGIDGFCCEVGDEQREQGVENINYAGIAIKGMLGKFHTANAKITVDGVTKEYKDVWLAPTMIGRYYGGGMDVAPEQNRLNAEKTVTSVVWHKKSKLGTLMRFPSIFKGA